MEAGLSPHERVAKMLVDHLIDFKGCKRHTAVIEDDITGMQEFMDDRNKLRDEIPQFTDPDFAQTNRLPVQARLPDDVGDKVEDEWRKFSQDPLWHKIPAEWNGCHQTVEYIFTGGDSSEDEDGVKLDQYLMVGKGDMIFANS